jgi:hypothetical protein
VRVAAMTNVRIACSMDGDLAAIGPVPIPGARQDAYAYSAGGSPARQAAGTA